MLKPLVGSGLAEFPTPALYLVWGVFIASPLWLCVYGVVLTKKDLVQSLSAALKAG